MIIPHIRSHVFWKILTLFTFLHLSSPLEVIIAYDESLYPDENFILSITQSLSGSVDWHKCSISNLPRCTDYFPTARILVDLSNDIATQSSISHLCQSRILIHLVLQNNVKFENKWTFALGSSKTQQINAVLSVLRSLNWTQGIAFNNKANYDVKEAIKDFSYDFNFLAVEEKSSIEGLINKVAFREGATVYCIFTNWEESLEIQKNLKKSKLLTAGNGIILDQESSYQCETDGALIITDFAHEFAISSDEYFKDSIISAVSFIINQTSNETAWDIQILMQGFRNSPNKNKFSLVNIQNGNRVVVGSIVNNNILITNNLTFPGPSNTIPKSTKKILNLSINAGPTNPYALPATGGVIAARGTYFAKDEINDGHTILPNFHIELFSYDCGATVYNAKFAYSCFLNDIDKFGFGHVSSYASNVAIGAMQTFKLLNVTFPIVGCSNTDASLNSTANFPMFTRVGYSIAYAYSLLSVLIKVMGYKKIAILYQNDSWAIGRSWYLNPAIDKQGLEIVNPESTWYIPAGLDREGLKNYASTIQRIVDSQARLLVLTMQYPMYNFLMEFFYDLGIRKGDLFFFATYLDQLTAAGKDDIYAWKRIAVGIPTFRMLPQNWVGKKGANIKEKITSMYKEPTNSYTCPYYDGIYIIAHALDYMINRGQDYTDPYKLEAAIRNQQFQGCTGKVTIEKGTNDRIVDVWDIEINQFDDAGNVITQFIGKLKPFSSQILSITNPIIYPDGTTIKPSDLRNENNKCPFPDKDIRTFPKGRGLLFGICFLVALVTFGITVLIWKKWWNISVDELKKKEEISVPDLIVGISIIVEFFQYTSMGPETSIFSSIVSKFANSLSLNLDDILKMENGVFWVVVEIVFGGIGLWAVLCAVVLLRLDEKWQFISIFKFLSWLADYLMPILGNLCFIPFISICLDVYLCDQSVGDDFTDSFLARDCHYFCWKDEHLVYAILSCLALILYVPLAIFCRPLWQELQLMLHVKVVPLYLMVKSIFQISLIVMNKTIKRSQEIAHSVLFIIVLLVYIIFTFKFKPYNYPRFSWWQGLSLIGVEWLAFISTIAIGIQDDFIPLLVVLIFGWFIIAIVGLYIQKKKYPSLLFRKSTKDTSTLFKFAFSFGKSVGFSKGKIFPKEQKIT
ncbi:unnamed protein product [Blepharisma stoltei]|uniref:Receptor ligand binding region domain-containing protein n=1 Tax=Blepharisma stoltei TaxID=1481888 RepID=A0AAU9J1C8_9CILI|nr:unnamed protein product [Blepharisma stoltei]